MLTELAEKLRHEQMRTGAKPEGKPTPREVVKEIREAREAAPPAPPRRVGRPVKYPRTNCAVCVKEFKPQTKTQKTCSVKCGGELRRRYTAQKQIEAEFNKMLGG